MIPSSIPKALVVAGVALLIATSAMRAQAPFSGGLGDVAGGSFYSYASGVSNKGTVVTGYSIDGSPYGTGFRWSLNGGMVSFNNAGTATAVNSDGSVIVGLDRNNNILQGFRYQNGTYTELAPLAGYSGSTADGVSANGMIAVGDSRSTTLRATAWNVSGQAQDLGVLSAHGNFSRANAASGDGAIIVGSSGTTSLGDGAIEAFRWTQSTGMVGLGDLAGGAFNSSASGISANGQVIVGDGTDANGQQAVRWVGGGAPQTLGNLNNPTNGSFASGVSSDGGVIVGASGTTAFVWDNKHGMQNLQSVLSSEYGVDFTGWTLTSANAIDPNATTIVGAGTDPLGNTEAFTAAINARTAAFTNGQSYAGFHTSHLGGFGISVDMLGGSATGGRSLTVTTTNAPTGSSLVSDVANVSGTATDHFVLQLSYEKTAAQASPLGEAVTRLEWKNPSTGQWELAVNGNTPDSTNVFVLGAYDPTVDNHLGFYGLDIANGTVWAVLDHNSDFSAGLSIQAVPEPATWFAGTAALGTCIVFTSRRRRKHLAIE